MREIGTVLTQLARRPLAKMLTRLILYGLAAVFAWVGIEKAAAESAQAVSAAEIAGDGLAALVLLLAAGLIDRLHHKADRAEPPPDGGDQAV